MAKQSRSYLDLFLDNITTTKKRGVYFTDQDENAIIKFNDPNTSEKERTYLFKDTIEPSFRRIIAGVLEMPMFHHLGKLNREDLIDNTFHRLVEKMNRFKAGMISPKSGNLVKAFSYFSTIAKNHILEQKVRNEKVLKHKADVESSIDLTILSEDTLEKMSNYDKQDVYFNSYEEIFKETEHKVISEIEKIIVAEEMKDKPDMDLIKLGYCLKYLIKKWDKVEFMKKNEFMRILSLYVGLKQQQVSLLFKKFKIAVLENINPAALNKNKSISLKEEKEDEEIDDWDINLVATDNPNESYEDSLEDEILVEEEEKPTFKYEVISMEDFEIESERLLNDNIKQKYPNNKKLVPNKVKE